MARLTERTMRMKVGNPMCDDTMVGAMISPQQAQKVLDYLEGAKQQVGSVLFFF